MSRRLLLLYAAILVSCSEPSAPVVPIIDVSPAVITKLEGDDQTVAVGNRPDQLGVLVTDAQGKPFAGAVVRWTPSEGTVVDSSETITNKSGIARVGVIAPKTLVPSSVQASVNGIAARATFTLKVVSALPAVILKLSGHGARVAVDSVIEAVIKVTDRNGNPSIGEQVRWLDIVNEEGAFIEATPALTDSNGVARARWHVGYIAGEHKVTVIVGPNQLRSTFIATAFAREAISLTVAPRSVVLGVGAETRLVATARDKYGNPTPVEWTSLNESIASVDYTGLIYTNSEGASTITATSGKMKFDIPVQVLLPIDELVTFNVHNRLVFPIVVSLDGRQDTVPAETVVKFSLRRPRTLVVNWKMVAPLDAKGLLMGVQLAGQFLISDQSIVNYDVDVSNRQGNAVFFSPEVINQSGQSASVYVYVGAGGYYGPVRVASGTRMRLGYYSMVENSGVGVYLDDSYSYDPDWYFGIANIAIGSGSITLLVP